MRGFFLPAKFAWRKILAGGNLKLGKAIQIGPQYLGNDNRAIGLLTILKHRN